MTDDDARAAPHLLERPDGHTLAWHARAGTGIGLVWLGGFKSDMTGTKATALDHWALSAGRPFIRFDYFGHGASSGDFRDGTIGRWADDAVAVLDDVAEGPQILIGSSMGAWIALLAARRRPEKVRGLVLLAPAADFTEALMWARMPGEVRAEIMEKGEWLRPSDHEPEPYPITRALIEEGRNHLVLPGPVPFAGPVRILQGMRDADVPWQHALKLVEAFESDDVVLTLIKDGDHRLSDDQNMARIIDAVEALAWELDEG
jgi:pimeloyl-ACP methyl ester carboxylesterase